MEIGKRTSPRPARFLPFLLYQLFPLVSDFDIRISNFPIIPAAIAKWRSLTKPTIHMAKIREVEAEVEVLPRHEPAGAKPADDPFIALVARLMDDVFTIPGTGIRFGLDPLIGLLPGLGATASAAVSLVLIALSARRAVPRVVLARMAVNVLLNAGLDAVPVVGDALSIFFRSNARNYELLRKHAGTARPTTRGDWLFLSALLGGAALLIVGCFAGLFYVVNWLFSAK